MKQQQVIYQNRLRSIALDNVPHLLSVLSVTSSPTSHPASPSAALPTLLFLQHFKVMFPLCLSWRTHLACFLTTFSEEMLVRLSLLTLSNKKCCLHLATAYILSPFHMALFFPLYFSLSNMLYIFLFMSTVSLSPLKWQLQEGKDCLFCSLVQPESRKVP